MSSRLIVLCSFCACSAPAVQEPAASERLTPLSARTTEPGLRPPRALVELVPIASEETMRALMPSAEKRAQLGRRHDRLWSPKSNAAKLVNPILGARTDPTLGQRLNEVLAALPPARAAFGVDALTYEQVWTDEQFCEGPKINLEFTHEGQRYEARYDLERYLANTQPRPVLYALSSTCSAALLASGGEVHRTLGGACTYEDQAAHFEPGSGCRSCLEVDGDLERCIGLGQCRRQTAREIAVMVDNQLIYYDVLESLALACAPQHTTVITILSEELGEDDLIAPAFTHGPIARVCEWHWHVGSNALRMYCTEKSGTIEPAFADVLAGRVEYIRKPGETATYHAGRFFISGDMELDGMIFDTFPLYPGTTAELSEREQRAGGWNYNPQDLRADGDDPSNIDHTLAREWISALTLKTATLIRGVFIVTFNHNLCADDAWRGPDSAGRYLCRNPGYTTDNPAPDENRWSYDWGSYSYPDDPTKILTFPWVTLAATGYPDPAIPGGHVIQILGSPTLADPEWDNCSYGETFQPDEMKNWDTSEEFGVDSYTSQTYRFGKDPSQPIRLVLGANWKRGFCPQTPPVD